MKMFGVEFATRELAYSYSILLCDIQDCETLQQISDVLQAFVAQARPQKSEIVTLLNKCIDALDPEMRRHEIVELRESLIRERNKYGT